LLWLGLIFTLLCCQLLKGVAATMVVETTEPAGDETSLADPGGEAQEALAALPAWVWVLVALGALALLPIACCLRAWWRNNRVDW